MHEGVGVFSVKGTGFHSRVFTMQGHATRFSVSHMAHTRVGFGGLTKLELLWLYKDCKGIKGKYGLTLIL